MLGGTSNEGDAGTVGGRRPSAAVVDAVARAKGVLSTELDQPLNDVVDPDALDGLFAARRDGTPRSGDVAVSFTYEGMAVTVSGETGVTVEPASE